jgi:Pyridoxal-dependent decarboxylase, pyridoxal binding domain
LITKKNFTKSRRIFRELSKISFCDFIFLWYLTSGWSNKTKFLSIVFEIFDLYFVQKTLISLSPNYCFLLFFYFFSRLLLRLRFDPKTTNKIGFGEKFGCMPGEKTQFLLRKAKDLNLNVKGIAFHIGVGCLEYEIFAKAIKDSSEAFDFGNSIGLKMELLDIGGGFPGAETVTIVIKLEFVRF